MPPDECCSGCGVELPFDKHGQLETHRCCACRDSGRVMRRPRAGGPGAMALCPACSTVPREPGQSPDQALEVSVKRARMAIPPLYANVTLESFDPRHDRHALDAARRWLAGWPVPRTPFLVFESDTKGNGKTTLAIATLREACDRYGVGGMFCIAPELLMRLRATNAPGSALRPEDLLDPVRDSPLLVLDDIGVGKQTDFVDEMLYLVVNDRANHMRPTIVTTNTWGGMDERIQSRLMRPAISEVLQFRGPDRAAA